MSDISYEVVVKLVDQLPPQEQTALITHLLELARKRELTKEERKVVLESMAVDLGAVSPDYSDRREDWYDDGGR